MNLDGMSLLSAMRIAGACGRCPAEWQRQRDLSRTLHPDKAKDGKGDPEGFAMVTRAYETLVEGDKRSM